MRGVLAISAVCLWHRAGQWDEAARAGCGFLASPEQIGDDEKIRIERLVERAWRMRELGEMLAPQDGFISLEARLSGGLVRVGLAPSSAVAERREVLTPLLLRTAELQSGCLFRRTGPSVLAGSYMIYEAPALASSYTLRLYIGATAQRAEVAAAPHEVVERFLAIATAAVEGAEQLRQLVPDEQYARVFLRGLRDLAPGGESVGEVSFSSVSRGRASDTVTLLPESRGQLTHALAVEGPEAPLTFEGVLKSVNLRGPRPSIVIEAGFQVARFLLRKGEHEDTIGPKLTRRVRVVGVSKRRKDGTVEYWAHDVLVLEDAPGRGRGAVL